MHGMWNFPNQRANPRPLHWKHGVLTSGPPGMSSPMFYNYKQSITIKNCESLHCTPITYNSAQQLYFNKMKEIWVLQSDGHVNSWWQSKDKDKVLGPRAIWGNRHERLPLYFLLHHSSQSYSTLPLTSFRFQAIPSSAYPESTGGLIFAFQNVRNIHLLSALVFPFWKNFIFCFSTQSSPWSLTASSGSFSTLFILSFISAIRILDKKMQFGWTSSEHSASGGRLGCSCIEKTVESNCKHLFLRSSWPREFNPQHICRQIMSILCALVK